MSLRSAAITGATRLLERVYRPRAAVPDNPCHILFLKPCCIGDVLLTTPLLHALRQRYPAAKITMGVGAWSRALVETSADVDAVWVVPDYITLPLLAPFVQSLAKQAFDMVLVPDRSPLLTVATALANIPIRIGLDSQGRGFAYTHRVNVPEGVIHEADLYNLLGTTLGLASISRMLHFTVPPPARRAAADLLGSGAAVSGPLVALHPGGGANPGMTLSRKRWPPDRWAAVADRLIVDQQATVLVVGGESDREATEAVKSCMSHEVTILTQQWEWPVLAAVIQQCDLFLGHDTGMMHLACAVGTPTLAIFGPTDPQIYGPYAARGRYLWRPTVQSPCFHGGQVDQDCPCAHRCMEQIEVSEVLAAVTSLLDDNPRTS